MNRRKLFGFLAALPFVGSVLKPDDGVALTSTAHPPWHPSEFSTDDMVVKGYELRPDLETVEIDLSVYAHAGDVVTCENGHEICTFKETVLVGQRQDLPKHLGDFRQESPEIGDPLPALCVICGAPFVHSPGLFHFADGWRGRDVGLGLRLRSLDG
jgi:hypothetical protein